MTKDSVTVSVDAVVYYRVSNATVSVANVENAHHSTRYRLIYLLKHHPILMIQTVSSNNLKKHFGN